MNEIWKTIPSYPEFEASNCGKIRDISTKRLPNIHYSADGYEKISIRKNRKWFSRTVHPLVLEAFSGPRPTGMDACHNDGNKNNNHISNLRWATRKENVADSIKHGTYVHGTKQGACKLTNEQVIEMRKRYENGISCARLAKIYNISKPNAHRIVTRVSWKHI